MKKWIKRIGITLVSILVLLLLGIFFINESLPEGEAGAEADALARKMMEAVNDKAWQETGAVSWVFAGARQHLWDRERHFARVAWDGNLVLVDINQKDGVVQKKNFETSATDEELILKAWEIWVNDSFWLNPVSKVFDPGTIRKKVSSKGGEEALLITYQSGGATPGDSYLWILDENGLPKAWKLWVSIVPIGGLTFSWDEWVTLPTGVKVSAFHHSVVKDLRLDEIKAARNLEALLGGEDPFEVLVTSSPEPENKPSQPEETPSDATDTIPDTQQEEIPINQ
ncbi:MAG: hypothetical protein AAFU64_13310 [Bacteroidota bacterium]